MNGFVSIDLGGGVAQIGDLLFETVRTTVRERVRMFPATDVRIEPSELGGQAGVWGGLAPVAQPDLISLSSGQVECG